MSETESLSLPESHLNILQIMSALAWADGDLSEEETDILLEEFKSDLPVNPQMMLTQDDGFFVNSASNIDPLTVEQIEKRAIAELVFKQIIQDYRQNPIPLADLVAKLETHEDRCFTAKLAYMLIKVSHDQQENLISANEKSAYRQLIDLLQLDDEFIKEIEWEANQELDEYQHPFKAFLSNIKHFFTQEIHL